MEASTTGLIADLEAGLEAARRLAAQQAPAPAEQAAPAALAPDTSMMPGGVDSAPVSTAETPIQKVERAVETEAVDIIAELKSGTSVSDIANKLLDQDGLGSIVKAIGDLAGKVF